MKHGFVDAAGVRLHYVEQGEGPLVVLLHGFPDFWYCWRFQLPALAAAGFRAVALDTRGVNESDRPRGVGAYDIDILADDVAAAIRALAPGARAHVVGHDWGGAIAWLLASRPRDADLVDRLAVLNVPHPARFARELWKPAQLLRSAYVFFFQLPRLPELLLSRHRHAPLLRALRRSPAFTRDDAERYREAWSRPGALTAMIDYYRAAARHGLLVRPSTHRDITRPALLVWGLDDPYLGPRLSTGMEPWAPGLRVERIAGAGHWVHWDAAERVNALLLEFLR